MCADLSDGFVYDMPRAFFFLNIQCIGGAKKLMIIVVWGCALGFHKTVVAVDDKKGEITIVRTSTPLNTGWSTAHLLQMQGLRRK